MPDWLAVVLLGAIEGITEFLPISSTGHLLLVENSRLLPPQPELFNVVIQTGAVLAVLLVFWDRARELVSGLGRPEPRDYAAKLVAAFLVTAVGGLAAKKAGFTLPKEIPPIAWATLIGGVGILLIEGWRRGKPVFTRIGWPVALGVGFAQIAAAVFPGTSRAAATILIALALGVSRRAATEFSFLLGIPTLFAAGGLEIVSELRHPGPEPIAWGMVALGTLVSAITAFLVVRWVLRFVQTHTFVVFGWYRVALGLAMIALYAWR